MKPLLDGKAIIGVMQVKSGGPLIGKWVYYDRHRPFVIDLTILIPLQS